jgi:tRNA (guanine-N7-)-methyltransferase
VKPSHPPIEIPIAPQPERLDPDAIFGCHQPLEVDIGSGKGRFLLARAAAHPDVNFIGIERQQRRVEKVASKAAHAGLANIRLLHTEIRFALEMLLPDQIVDTFYIFYPDPWPKRRHAPRRLINPDFVRLLHRKVKPHGRIHFATDDLDYFTAAASLFEASLRFTPCEPFIPCPQEQTDFERLFSAQGRHANRCSFTPRMTGSPTEGAVQ